MSTRGPPSDAGPKKTSGRPTTRNADDAGVGVGDEARLASSPHAASPATASTAAAIWRPMLTVYPVPGLAHGLPDRDGERLRVDVLVVRDRRVRRRRRADARRLRHVAGRVAAHEQV